MPLWASILVLGLVLVAGETMFERYVLVGALVIVVGAIAAVGGIVAVARLPLFV